MITVGSLILTNFYYISLLLFFTSPLIRALYLITAAPNSKTFKTASTTIYLLLCNLW